MFTLPHGVAVGPDDSVYCVDTGDHTVRKFTPEGELLMTIGEPGNAAPTMSGRPFCRPTHLAVDPRNGDLLISDGYGNARVHRYTSDGQHLASWGESGTDPGTFNIPHNIDVDRDGVVYVADRENRPHPAIRARRRLPGAVGQPVPRRGRLRGRRGRDGIRGRILRRHRLQRGGPQPGPARHRASTPRGTCSPG